MGLIGSLLKGNLRNYSNIIRDTDVQKLNEYSKKLHLEALNIISGKLTKEDKLRYIQAFPHEFDVFLSIFHPSDFGQLYDGHIYIGALSKMTPEFTDEIGEILFKLSSKACLDADAPNYLRRELELFEKGHPLVYKQLYESTDLSGRSNIEIFKAASLHEMGAGTCSF
jgi:hypothetical protein